MQATPATNAASVIQKPGQQPAKNRATRSQVFVQNRSHLQQPITMPGEDLQKRRSMSGMRKIQRPQETVSDATDLVAAAVALQASLAAPPGSVLILFSFGPTYSAVSEHICEQARFLVLGGAVGLM